MYTTILVPLDGSRYAQGAIPYAAALAQAGGGEVHLVHVLATAVSGWMPDLAALGAWESRTRQEKQEYLDGWAERIRKETGVTSTATLLEDGIIESLGDHADQIGADLVVMSTHGRGGLERAWLGSVADRFVRTAERPVLLVPAEEEPAVDLQQLPSLRTVLVPLDGSALAEEILPAALKLGDDEPVTFILASVVTLPPMTGLYGPAPYATQVVQEEVQLRREKQKEAKEYLQGVRARLESVSRLMVPTVLFSSQPAAAILEHAREEAADVIAIATRGRGGVARMVFGSVADKVIRAPSAPVLVYRPRAEAEAKEAERTAGAAGATPD